MESRILPIDAARGFAMLMVCLSHIRPHIESAAPRLEWLLTVTSRIATPSFLLISGFLIGHLLRTDQRGGRGLALIDRGLFLLIVARLLLDLETLAAFGFVDWYFGKATLIDAIGVALFFAVALRRASAATLTIVGTSFYMAGWIIATTQSFESEWGNRLASALFGTHSAPGFASLPLVPYLGIFLLGMGLSAHLQSALMLREHSHPARRLMIVALGALASVAVGIAGWRFVSAYVPMDLPQALNPFGKDPPSPAYLLFYGGGAVLLLAVFFRGRPAWVLEPAMRKLAVIGKASLLCFIVQDWMLTFLPARTGLNQIDSPGFWFAWLALFLLGLYALAGAWNRISGNRFLTVGLRALATNAEAASGTDRRSAPRRCAARHNIR